MFWVMAAGNAHRLPKKDIVKILVSDLKPDIFREIFREIYSRSCENLVVSIAETKHELSNYRDIIEISDRIKRPKVKKDLKDGMPEASISRKSGSYTKAPIEASFAKDSKPSNAGKTTDIKDVECLFKCYKKGHYANMCPDAKVKDGKGYFKFR